MYDVLKVDFNVNEYNDIQISLNLAPYIEAFANRKSDPNTYLELKRELRDIVSRSSANGYWDRILSLYTDKFETEKVKAIENSPAVEILSEHFAEIFMNSIDETLQAHHADNHNSTVMEMTIRFDSSPKMVSIDIIDNGRGYPPEFIKKVQTSSTKRNEYILSPQGSTNLKKHDAHLRDKKPYDGPDLVGGRGLGMRFFLADAQNDKLIGLGPNKKLNNIYPKSPAQSLNFGNLQDLDENFRGAIINLTTPLQPRKSHAELMQETKIKEKRIVADSRTDSNDSISASSSELSLDFSDINTETDDDSSQNFSPK